MTTIASQQPLFALEQPQQPSSLKAGPSEFMRRKDWSQSILDELRDIVHVLSPNFKILYCSPASTEFLGFDQSELVGHLFTEYIHVDDVDTFARSFRFAKDTMQPLRTYFRVLHKDGRYVTLETTGHFYKSHSFLVARVIPMETTRTMDMFLELKMENERLRQQMLELKSQYAKKQQEDEAIAQAEGEKVQDNDDDDDDEEEEEEEEEEGVPDAEDDEDQAARSPAPHVYSAGVTVSFDVSQSLSLLTGLRYDKGERSRGISMGMEGELLNESSELVGSMPTVVGPVDIDRVAVRVDAASLDEHSSEFQKKTKKKRMETTTSCQLVCTECGATSSPEWRRGPMGPKTLCNACGIRWGKSQNQSASTGSEQN